MPTTEEKEQSEHESKRTGAHPLTRWKRGGVGVWWRNDIAYVPRVGAVGVIGLGCRYSSVCYPPQLKVEHSETKPLCPLQEDQTTHTPWSSWRAFTTFFLRLNLVVAWKNFVFLSPAFLLAIVDFRYQSYSSWARAVIPPALFQCFAVLSHRISFHLSLCSSYFVPLLVR